MLTAQSGVHALVSSLELLIYLRCSGSEGNMASGPGPFGAQSRTSVSALPPELLQHIVSSLQEPADVASCHMVDTRYSILCCLLLP